MDLVLGILLLAMFLFILYHALRTEDQKHIDHSEYTTIVKSKDEDIVVHSKDHHNYRDIRDKYQSMKSDK